MIIKFQDAGDLPYIPFKYTYEPSSWLYFHTNLFSTLTPYVFVVALFSGLIQLANIINCEGVFRFCLGYSAH